jgi:hypothetical protein
MIEMQCSSFEDEDEQSMREDYYDIMDETEQSITNEDPTTNVSQPPSQHSDDGSKPIEEIIKFDNNHHIEEDPNSTFRNYHSDELTEEKLSCVSSCSPHVQETNLTFEDDSNCIQIAENVEEKTSVELEGDMEGVGNVGNEEVPSGGISLESNATKELTERKKTGLAIELEEKYISTLEKNGE